MELKLQRNLVLQELSILQGVVEHRTTIPILSSILAEAEENRLRMVATDLDMTIVTECAAGRPRRRPGDDREQGLSKPRAQPARGGVFAAAGRRLASRFPAAVFTPASAVADPAEYPTVPDVPEAGGYCAASRSLSADARPGRLRHHQGRSRSSSSTERWSSSFPGEIEIAATDGHRLADGPRQGAGGIAAL